MQQAFSQDPDLPLNLSIETVRRQWVSEDVRTAQIFEAMQTAEDWTLDGNADVEQAINQFGARINESESLISTGRMSNELIFVMAYMKVGRAMRLMKWLDLRVPGVGLRMVQAGRSSMIKDPNDQARIMMERLEMLKRIEHLGRVFSHSRLQFILKAMVYK